MKMQVVRVRWLGAKSLLFGVINARLIRTSISLLLLQIIVSCATSSSEKVQRTPGEVKSGASAKNADTSDVLGFETSSFPSEAGSAETTSTSTGDASSVNKIAPGDGKTSGEKTKKDKFVDEARKDVGVAPPASPPKSSGVKAGSSDDNLQFNAFLDFVEKNRNLGLACDVSRRVVMKVKDRDGLPLADAKIQIKDGEKTLLQRRTYADGRALLFSSELPELQGQSVRVQVTVGSKSQEVYLNASQMHSLEFQMDLRRGDIREIPLDIAFVMDTTGSMGDQIAQLKQTLEYINFQVSNLTPRPQVRFGMVLYRDRGDDYVTRVIPFTSELKQFSSQLNQVEAGGGGDTPEDVQAGMEQAITALSWRDQGAKLLFLVGDAPPHLDYGGVYTYVQAMRDAASRGIKITTIGASGLDLQGELVWRQMAQYTLAPFVFLTKGEKGDSEGSASTVSHHVGSNWVAENLDAIIIRMVKLELAHYSPKGAPPTEDYFAAGQSQTASSDQVLDDLFSQSVKQLIDYSVQRIERLTPTVVLPVKFAEPKLKPSAEKLESRLALGLVKSGEFQLIESKDRSELLKTLSSQFVQQYDSSKVVEMGKQVPAKLAIFSQLDTGNPGKIEMMVKLVRLETGEILSLSLMKIEEGLLLAKK